MALNTLCEKCGNVIGKQTRVCPRCGFRRRKRRFTFKSLIVLFCIGYVIFPYYAIYTFYRAIESGDEYSIKRGIELESLKRSLTSGANRALGEYEGEHKVAAELTKLFIGFGIIDENMILDIIKETDPRKLINKIRYVFFTNPTTFLVKTNDGGDIHSN